MITPAWTAPNTVSALSTTRQGGVSVAPFDSFNVGLHVGDDEQAVLANRALLTNQLPNPAVWLNQTHSSDVIVIDEKSDPLKSPLPPSILRTALPPACSKASAEKVSLT